MVIIAHRGNIDGPHPEHENNPSYIEKALKKGYDVEIDVWWFRETGLSLGHDFATYPISESFLENPRVWCHAKNIVALKLMLDNPKIHCFWHEEDKFTLTSKGFIWTFPGINGLTEKSIAVMPEKHEDMALYNPESWQLKKCAGICTDYCNKFKDYSF